MEKKQKNRRLLREAGTDANAPRPKAVTASPEASTAGPQALTADLETGTTAPEAVTESPGASTAGPRALTADLETGTTAPEAVTESPGASTADPQAHTALSETGTTDPEVGTAGSEAVTEASEADTEGLNIDQTKKSEIQQASVETRVFDINAKTYMLEKFERNAMIIFNQEEFYIKDRRNGTSFDEKALIETFEQFRFDVTVHKDLKKAMLFAELQKLAVLTHGRDHGYLYASDEPYSERELFARFVATKNRSLAGKPIIFLIQACRGSALSNALKVPGPEGGPKIELDSHYRPASGYFLPKESDMVIFFSSFFGKASAREPDKGSWFIQILCEQINQHAFNEDLETIFRRVRNIVALEKEFRGCRQMPVVTTTLLKKLFLKRHGESASEIQHFEISKEPRIAVCPSCSGRLIETYFESTTICLGMSSQLEYCNKTITEHPIDMSKVIDLYRTQERVHSYKYNNPNTPTTAQGVLVLRGGRQLPLYEIADIRGHHLHPQSEPEVKNDINEHMKLMGRLNTDDVGYLLHPSLGGSSRSINVIPMARNVHQPPIVADDGWARLDINKLKPPRSFWKSNEDWIQKFLNFYPNGRVAWRVAVQYEEGVITNPENFIDYRPVSFSLQYTACTDKNDDSSYYTSPQMTFRNDNMIMKSRGVWNLVHKLSFPYTILGRTYFCIGTDGTCFIKELLPNGQMGETISGRLIPFSERTDSSIVVVPFAINGRHFFFLQYKVINRKVIQELLPDGKLGEETFSCSLNDEEILEVAFAFSINDVPYIFGQSNDYTWCIGELLPCGKIGKETSRGTWNSLYKIGFPYEINKRQFCYLHSHNERSWLIRELLPGGQMGKVTDYGYWDTAHMLFVPYSVNGKHYFFREKVENGKWYIQELCADGRMGVEITVGEYRDPLSVAFTFSINGEHYIYGFISKTNSWFIKELSHVIT